MKRVNRKRILHDQVIKTYCDFDGLSIIELISTMEMWLEEARQQGFDNLKLVSEWDSKAYYTLLGDKIETEEEFVKRMKHEEVVAKRHKILKEKNKAKIVEHERKEYERLRSKFEFNISELKSKNASTD